MIQWRWYTQIKYTNLFEVIFMQSNDIIEKAYSDFLETEEYDKANEAIYVLVRAAFLAGWTAALSQTPASN